MKKLIIVGLFVGIMLFGALFVSAAITNKLEFNGDFEEGETLYTDKISVDNVRIWAGRNGAYPIRGERICENITVREKQRVCEEICYNGMKTCYMLDDEEEFCTYKEYSKERCTKKCGYEYVDVIKEVCHYESYDGGVLCENPRTGISTNQLHYTNFYYRIREDGVWSDWLDLQVYHNSEPYENVQKIQAKVEIPDVCYPDYNIDNVVYIQTW